MQLKDLGYLILNMVLLSSSFGLAKSTLSEVNEDQVISNEMSEEFEGKLVFKSTLKIKINNLGSLETLFSIDQNLIVCKIGIPEKKELPSVELAKNSVWIRNEVHPQDSQKAAALIPIAPLDSHRSNILSMNFDSGSDSIQLSCWQRSNWMEGAGEYVTQQNAVREKCSEQGGTPKTETAMACAYGNCFYNYAVSCDFPKQDTILTYKTLKTALQSKNIEFKLHEVSEVLGQ
jgi:hypothetical protein